MDDTFEVFDWQQSVMAIAEHRSGERTLGDSDLVANVTFMSYRHVVEEPGQKKKYLEVLEVPAQRKAKKKAGGTFPANLEIFCSVDSLREIINVCERSNENSWAVQTAISYSEEAVKEFRDVAAHVWNVKENPDLDNAYNARIREYVAADGMLVETRMRQIDRGAKVLFKVFDGANNTIYRSKHEAPPCRPKVRRYVKLKLTKLVCVEYVAIKEENEEKRVSSFFSIKVEGQSIVSEDDDSRFGESEQIHMNMNPHAHQLIPVNKIRSGDETLPASVYYYLKNMNTPYNRNNLNPNAEGITLVRVQTRPDDFYKIENDVCTGRFCAKFFVTQWKGKNPSTPQEECEQYLVKVLPDRNDAFQWTSFGITDPAAYASILFAHSNTDRDKTVLYLPIHLELNFWKSSTLKDKHNHPDELNNRKDLAHMRGYMLFNAVTIVPDYLRYFRANGLQVSTDFVKAEFEPWIETKSVKNVERCTISLEQRDAAGELIHDGSLRQPSKAFLSQDVIPIGNGRLLFPDASESEDRALYGKNHAFTGKTSELFDGTRDFYILTSYTPNATEIEQHYPPRNRNMADAYVTSLKKRDWNGSEFHYWIFAVKRDAVIATQRVYDTSKLPPLTDAIQVGQKRPAEEDAPDQKMEMTRAKVDEVDAMEQEEEEEDIE